MSIGAINPLWSSPNGSDRSVARTDAQDATSAFQTTLRQWQGTVVAGTQNTGAGPAMQTGTQPAQQAIEEAPPHHHHYHHHHEMDGSQLGGRGSIQSALSGLVGAIANDLEANGTTSGGTAATSSNASTTDADAALQSAVNTLVADIAQALPANGTAVSGGAAATSGTAAAANSTATVPATDTSSGTATSIQAAEATLVADLAQALQAYGVNQATKGNVLASL